MADTELVMLCAYYPVRGSDGAAFAVSGYVPLGRWQAAGGTIAVVVDNSYYVGSPAAPERLPLPGEKVRLGSSSIYRVYGVPRR